MNVSIPGFKTLSLCALTALLPHTASGTNIINEADFGDFANVPFEGSGVPTAIGSLSTGVTLLNGKIGMPGDQYDTFSFEIASGHVLNSLVFSGFTPSVSGDYLSIYLNRGAFVSFDAADEVEFINLADYATLGLDFLQFDSAPGPLGAGHYTMKWESHNGFSEYQAEFNVSAVPVPAAIWLMGAGLLSLVGFGRSKRR